jgi:hypothetical protein
MGRVIPQITNGSLRLVLNETVLIQTSDGLTVAIPLGPVNRVLTLQISFAADNEGVRSAFTSTGDVLELKLFNLLGPRHGGTSTPYGITIGNVQFRLLLSAIRISEAVSQLTLALYQE